jgi:photosystem II stability/assembly factor-like uncharacterized protein
MKKISVTWPLLFIAVGVLLMITSACKKDEREIQVPVLSKPVLSATTVSNISFITALCGGKITSEGSSPVTARGVCWNTNPNPDTSNNKTIDGPGTGSFVTIISGLQEYSKYYVRAYATNNAGTSYGNELVFTTLKVDSTIGFVVGSGGTILKTANGGLTWTAQFSGTSYNLYSVYFTDAINGYAVGGSRIEPPRPGYGYHYIRTILKTVDGGTTWIDLSSDNALPLSSVYFTDANKGYAVGGDVTSAIKIIKKTQDGGFTWTTVADPPGNFNLLCSVYFPNPNTGYAAGNNGTIIKTIDEGTTWTALSSGGTEDLCSVFFTDVNTGYAAGGHCDMGNDHMTGCIIKTMDGGITWSLSTKITLSFTSVYFADANTGYASGYYSANGNYGGTILKSTDAGTTWTELINLPSTRLSSVYFTNAEIGYAAGENGVILKTVDGGITWDGLSSGTTAYLNSVFFVKPK